VLWFRFVKNHYIYNDMAHVNITMYIKYF
jgi:hypothetical protein